MRLRGDPPHASIASAIRLADFFRHTLPVEPGGSMGVLRGGWPAAFADGSYRKAPGASSGLAIAVSDGVVSVMRMAPALVRMNS